MCPIFGIFDWTNADLYEQTHSIIGTLNPKRSGEAWLVSNGVAKKWGGRAEPVIGQALGQVSFATREQPAEQPGFNSGGNLAVLYEGNLYNIDEIKARLAPSHKLSTGNAAETVARLIEDRHQGDLVAALKQVARLLDGAYCLAASDGSQVAVMRDTVGLRPIFYAEDSGLMAFASKKMALWEMGLRNVKPLRAGMLASFSRGEIHIYEACPLGKIEATINDLSTAVNNYCALLKAAIEKRLRNLRKVGVLISGGVDSCLVAKLVSDIAAEKNIEVTAYTAGVYGATDIEYAERFTQELGLTHKVRRLRQDEIESYIPRVVAAVEERDLVQVEAGIGIYAAVEMASQDGIKVIFSGQGPDELWGGYTWYPQVIAKEGYEGLLQRMWNDLARADIETLDRENKIALTHGVEKVFPYVDIEVVRLAMSVSPHLKITSAEDITGKRPHREAAKQLGLPAQYADRSKDAAQHGTGIHETLDAIARKNGFTPEVVARTGYSSEEVSLEKLASSTRYGYLYAQKELWQVPQHIQFFFDSAAYALNMLNETERSKIASFLRKAGLDEGQ